MKRKPVHIDTEEDTTPFHTLAPNSVTWTIKDWIRSDVRNGSNKKDSRANRLVPPHSGRDKTKRKIRLCIDLTKLNTVTNRKLYQLDSTVKIWFDYSDVLNISSTSTRLIGFVYN